MSRRTFVLILVAVFAANTAFAQTTSSAPMTISAGASEMPPLGPKVGMAIHLEDMDAEPVKGAPFCATIATEHTQIFSDGNRIHTSDNSSLCRDGEGRTRREAGLNLLGAATQTSAPKLITIVDPVAGFRYMLDSESKTAHKVAIRSTPHAAGIKVAGPGGTSEKGEQVIMYQRFGTGDAGNAFFKKGGQTSDEPAPTTESLGDQMIDGVHATGTRMTTTIPSGKMGNDQPILVTSERWYSPELKATVMTKHNDPWAGELKTQFTNVNTSEPDSSLFAVPSDYKVVSEKAGPFMIQKRFSEPPAPPQ
jgi:hypothetical protein